MRSISAFTLFLALTSISQSFAYSLRPRAPNSLSTTPTRTNAERFQRGLPPMPPRTRKRKAVNPRAPVPSNQVCPPVIEKNAKLEVLDTSDDILGYVSSLLYEDVYTYRFTTDEAEVVTLPSDFPFYSTFQLSVSDKGLPYFGAADAGLGPLGIGLPGYANIVPVNTSPVNSPPSQGDSSESTIWDIACLPDDIGAWKLSVQWTNADGSQPTTYIIYDANLNQLLLTGDANAYNSANNGQASVVTFAFAP